MAENTPVEDVEIDKDTLITLLKEKGKEIKAVENKNKKLEERYVKIFRENKNLSKDKETLEKLSLLIFDRDQERFTNVESGTYDLNALTELWNQRQDEKLKLFNETLGGLKTEKRQLESSVSSLEKQLETAKNKYNPETEKIAETYKQRRVELENVNKKLNQEIKELNQLLEEKDEEINRLKSSEYELDSIKAELLMKELHVKNVNEDLNLKGRMQENDRRNELLKLKHDLESAQEKIRNFESEHEKAEKVRLENLKSEAVQTDPTVEVHHPTNIQTNTVFSPDERLDISPAQKPSFSRSNSDIPNFSENGGVVNTEYLKNVILKLFCYIEGNNQKEAKTLMHAIEIILKMTPEDKRKIEEARNNSGVWNSTFSFFKDTFTNKGEVNYYHHHNNTEQK